MQLTRRLCSHDAAGSGVTVDLPKRRDYQKGVSYYQKGLYHYQKGVGYYQEGIDAYLKILNGFFDNKAARTGNSNQIPKHSIVG